MGDVFLIHDQSGKNYYERYIWLIILISVFGTLSYISLHVNIVVSIAVGLLGAVVILSYVGYFIYKNPPQEYSKEVT